MPACPPTPPGDDRICDPPGSCAGESPSPRKTRARKPHVALLGKAPYKVLDAFLKQEDLEDDYDDDIDDYAAA